MKVYSSATFVGFTHSKIPMVKAIYTLTVFHRTLQALLLGATVDVTCLDDLGFQWGYLPSKG